MAGGYRLETGRRLRGARAGQLWLRDHRSPSSAEPPEPARAAHRRAERSHLHQAHRAHPAAQLPELPSPRRRGADVAHHLRRSAAVGARDQAAHRHRAAGRRDAAVVHREEHRHPALQGRSVAQRRRDRDDRQVGRHRRARAAIPPTCRRRSTSTTAATGASASPMSIVSTKEVLVKGDAPDWWGEIEEHSDSASPKIATSRPSRSGK